MSRGSRYSDEDRRKAVQEYLVCGSLAMVGEATGIPRKTLSDWFRSEWWDQLTAELRQEDGEPELAGEHSEVLETKLGRPTSYKSEYAEQTTRLCLLGATDQDLAAAFFKMSRSSSARLSWARSRSTSLFASISSLACAS